MPLATLPTDQLAVVEQQTQEELEQLAQVLEQCRAKERECQASCDAAKQLETRGSRPMLIPLTDSMYVKGKTSTHPRVTINIGTGYHAEVSVATAVKLLEGRAKNLAKSTEKISQLCNQKQDLQRAIKNQMHVRRLAASK